MQHHEIRIWHVYLCPKCNASDPPKDKYVVTVCKRKDTIWGFFINTPDSKFIRSHPELQKQQVTITPDDCRVLRYESNIGCDALKEFYAWELSKRECALTDALKQAILTSVELSDTLDAEKVQIIKDNQDTH